MSLVKSNADFIILKLDDLLELLTDYHANGAYEKLKENVELLDADDYAVMIRTTNFEQNNFSTNLKFITEKAYNFLNKSKVKPNDLIMNKIANAGSIYIMPDLGRPVSLAMNLFLLRINETKANPIYVYIYLKINELYVKSFANGSVTKTITKEAVRNLEIRLPDFDSQNKIAKLYTDLTERISLLRETNTTLEAIAQTLFKSWFVDFDPVKAKAEGKQPEGMDEATAAFFPSEFEESALGLIPKGWSISTIGETCEFQNGYAFKSNEMTKSKEYTYKVFKMGNIKKGGGLNRSGTKDYFPIGKSDNLERYLLKKGDLLMCMTDMKNNVALLGHTALMDIDNEFLLNQRVGMLRSKDASIVNYPFLYILTNSEVFIEDLRRRANSGVQVNLSTSEIKNTKFILPPKNIHQRFNEIVEATFGKLFLLEQQQDSLTEIRDTLLPRLISGQLRINQAQDLINEVGA